MYQMITEDYVPFEIAQLLKRKGFDVPVQTAYNCDGRPFSSGFKNWNKDKSNNADISRPTLQMAIKWLRVKGIVITFTNHFPMTPEYCVNPFEFKVEDYRPERDKKKEHGRYMTGYGSMANMDDFLVQNNLISDELEIGLFKDYETATEAAIKLN